MKLCVRRLAPRSIVAREDDAGGSCCCCGCLGTLPPCVVLSFCRHMDVDVDAPLTPARSRSRSSSIANRSKSPSNAAPLIPRGRVEAEEAAAMVCT